MFENVIIIRVGEIYLKGKNKVYFTNRLTANIKKKLQGIECSLQILRNRYMVTDYKPCDEKNILNRLLKVFGIYSLSCAKICDDNFENICNLAIETVPDKGSFKVRASRAVKNYFLNSMQIAAQAGARILQSKPALTVDLHNPDFIVNIDIRENSQALIYHDSVLAAGGMPVGTAGIGLLLLSGGIDSPVAGYMMAKRGMTLDALHFYSYPYTSEMAVEKVKTLAQKLSAFAGSINLITIKLTHLQEEINRNADSSYMITLLRRAMMRISEQIALERGCGCIINGESLAQVASQTLESLIVTNSVVAKLPVMRPLIGFDKEEIITIAKKIDTFETSILPYEDCCTVFLPKSPVTKPTIERAVIEENKLSNYDNLIQEALDSRQITEINNF